MGATTSSTHPHRPSVCRPFVPGEFAVAWLTFKGDSVENMDHRYVAKKDGLLSSRLLQRLYGAATMQCFADEEGDFVSREMFVCTLALCYEGNTEDRISYIFTMYGIIYGLERENEGCMLKKDYTYLLDYLEGFNSIPKKFYSAFDDCRVPPHGMLRNSQFVEWVRKYPMLVEFLASHLPPESGGVTSPLGVRTSDDFMGHADPLNSSPSCRDREKSGGSAAMFGSFDFIGGEDSGDESDEAYDSDQISEMDDFGAFQSARMHAANDTDDDRFGDGSDRSESEDHTEGGASPQLTPTSEQLKAAAAAAATGSSPRRPRGSRTRGVHKMGRNITKTLGGGISKVGRTILHGGKASGTSAAAEYGQQQGHHSQSSQSHSNHNHVNDPTSTNLLGVGYSFSSESQISKNYVCGYLHKISDGKWSKRSWHRRWFVLDRQQGVLSYYRHNPANHISSTPRGNIVHMEDDKPPPTTNDHSNGAGPSTSSSDLSTGSESMISVTSPRSFAAANNSGHRTPPQQHMLYLNKSHPWYRGELNLNLDNVSLLFEKSLARNAPTKYFFQVSTLSLQEIDSKRGVQYKLCAESMEEFDHWTLAIAAAINKKHTEHVKSEPTLSHQQVYRQKLLEEQQRRQNEEEQDRAQAQAQAQGVLPSNSLANATGETPESLASGPTKPLNHTTTSTAKVSKPKRGKQSPSPPKPRSSVVPPRIVTYCPSPTTCAPQSQWRLQVDIDGSKQCLILGFIVNIVALKCVAPEHALWKLLVCIGVSCAYVASIYNPPSTRRVSNAPSAGLMRRLSESGVMVVDASTDAATCADPGSCCLHKCSAVSNAAQPESSTCSSVNGVAAAAALPSVVLSSSVASVTKFPLGISMARSEATPTGKASSTPQSWATTRAETFQIRSQEYKKSKRKESSKAALFEFVGADLLRTDQKVDLISQRLELPDECADDKVFIINAQLPSYGPSVWGDPACDGPGFTLALCWRIPPEICEELKDPKSKELRLFKRFQQAGNDASLTDRFKVIAQVTNQDECGLTGMAKKLLVSHNSTPVLTRPQHRIYHFDKGSTEIVVDIHAFSYIARRGIHMLLDKCANLVIDVAFVLQGETEDELPERILGCCRLDCLDIAKAMEMPR